MFIRLLKESYNIIYLYLFVDIYCFECLYVIILDLFILQLFSYLFVLIYQVFYIIYLFIFFIKEYFLLSFVKYIIFENV